MNNRQDPSTNDAGALDGIGSSPCADIQNLAEQTNHRQSQEQFEAGICGYIKLKMKSRPLSELPFWFAKAMKAHNQEKPKSSTMSIIAEFILSYGEPRFNKEWKAPDELAFQALEEFDGVKGADYVQEVFDEALVMSDEYCPACLLDAPELVRIIYSYAVIASSHYESFILPQLALAKVLEVSQPRVSQMIKALKKRGLIEVIDPQFIPGKRAIRYRLLGRRNP